MSRVILLIASLVLSLLSTVSSENILFFHNVCSYSHRVQTYPLADALEKKGHTVTYISPFQNRGPYINPNITEIVPKKHAEMMEAFLEGDFDINFRVQKLLPRNVFAFFPAGIEACKALLSSPELREYLENTKKLDLIVFDGSLPECGMSIAYKYGAKYINFATVVMIGCEHDILGIAPESSSIPELELDPPQTPMTFLERVFNALISIHYRYEHWKYVHQIDDLVRDFMIDLDPKYKDMPFVGDLSRNTSLVLYTGDIVTDYPRSHPPMMINVGGLHCKLDEPVNELPKDIKEFLESDENDGFIYISLGSLVISSKLPKEITKAFFDTMETFPNLKFLWKWNGPRPEKMPKNLFLGQWFPQMDLLGHAKIRGFVSQSGRPSMLESLCSGVPMISVPVLGDQDVNANRMNKMGGNVVLELGTVTKEELQAAVQKIAYDKGMRERIKELQKILLDRPMSPLETAVWHTEYVLRHKDLSHLKSASFDQYWFQRRHIDIWVFVYTVILASIYLIYKVCTLLIKTIGKIMSEDEKKKISDTNINNNNEGLNNNNYARKRVKRD